MVKILDTLTYSAPPCIPTVFLMITNVARTRLDRAGIALLYAKALHFGAHINMVCFDKTGTLTDSVVSPFSLQQLCLGLDSTAIHFHISIVARLAGCHRCQGLRFRSRP